ncbi:MAG: PorP/SprF family type IX secretion system membrane protein [Chitinophagales bacterium]
MPKKYLILFCFFFIGLQFKLQAQDIHYTQYSFLPALQNSANTGLMSQDFRFSTIYRNQWASVPVNYNSLGFSFDLNFLENFNTGSKAGAGLNFYFDQAGDSRLQTLHLMIPLAYHIFIPIKDNTFKISLGVEAGVQYKSLSTDALYYDSQFNGEVFDATANNNEDFTNLNVLNPDIGAGINFEFETENDLRIGLGFSMKHLNNITETYQNSNLKPTLRKRFTIPAYAKIPLGNKWDVNISYLFNEQNKSIENTTGVMFGYYLLNIGEFKKKLNFGVFYRFADAPSIAVQYETNNYKFGLSYDITASKFAKATNTYGGVEIAATYLISKVIKPNMNFKRKCYTF